MEEMSLVEVLEEVIRKTKGGYAVYSKKKTNGKRKRLSKPSSKKKTLKRLRQIEYFKHHPS